MIPTVVLDGIDVTGYVNSGSVTRRLNRPATATWHMPIDLASGDVGNYVKIYFDGSLFFNGTVLTIEDTGDEDSGSDKSGSVYMASDPMELWGFRPVRDSTGNFSKPDITSLDGATTTGPAMMIAVLNNTQSAGAGPPSDAEGPILLAIGSDPGSCVDLSGAPVDWPMTILELATLLTSTGELDLVITPTDIGDGNLGRVDFYCGNYGSDLSATVKLQYATGNQNVRQVRRNVDMTNMANKIWYYLGPRVLTSTDPAGDSHWRGNITGDDPGLANPPGGDVNPYVPGASPLGDLIYNSRLSYQVRMDVQIHDSDDSNNAVRPLWQRLWQDESILRAQPRTLVHLLPVRTSSADLLPAGVTPVQVGDFDIGDLIHVEAGSILRGGFSGSQRVYSYTCGWDEDRVIELTEIQSSEDAEAA